MTTEIVVARAREVLGVRFRPQGRDAAYGLDCIGVVTAAFRLPDVRRDYLLRSDDVDAIEDGFAQNGFVRIASGGAGAGDVLLVRAGHAQLHVVLLTPDGYVHADAGLRRVVEVPGAVPWRVASAWRQVTPSLGEQG